MHNFLKKFFVFCFIFSLLSGEGLAALLFSTENDGVHSPVFILDSGDTSDDYIDLEFGATLDAKLRYDVILDKFVVNRDIDLSDNEIVNARLQNSATAPNCDNTVIGKIYHNTADSNTYVCNGSVWEQLDMLGGLGELATARYRDTSTTDLNASTTDNLVPWDTEDLEDATTFAHDTVTNNSRVEVLADGKYFVSGTINVQNSTTSVFRYNGRVKFRVNGVTVLPMRFQPGYIRQDTGQTETSLVFTTVLDLNANDYFEILVDRENTNAGPANMISGQSSLSVVQLRAPQGPAGPTGATGSPGADGDMTWAGAWVSQNYLQNQVVSYQGSSYVCILNTVSNEPPSNPTYWELMVSKGDPGSVGAGTSSDTFTLDDDDTATDISLVFGTVLNETLTWNGTLSRFELSDDLGLSNSEIQDVRLENLASAPTCDGTAIGKIYYNTTNANTYVCNGTAWEQLDVSAQAMNDMAAARYSDNSIANINAATTDNLVPWNIEAFEDVDVFVHDTVTNNSRIQVAQDGKYLVSGTVSISGANTRYNGKLKFRLNGSTVLGPRFQPGYIRNSSSQDETSLNFSIILDLAANEYFEILVDREGGGTQPVYMNANESTLSIVQLRAAGSSGAPFINTASIEIPPSTTQTFSINGEGFLPTSTVSIPGFTGTINSTTVVSPTQIDVDVTTTATTGTYDVIVDNGGIDNTTWSGNGVGIFDITLITGTGPAGTYTESFEAGLGNWTDSGLDVAWTNNSGGTPSGGTGPTVASDGTFYMFAEASSPNFPDFTFGLETTHFNVAQSVSFDYHMYGAAMGDLEVQTLRSGVWTTRFTLSGQQQTGQGDAYLNQFVDLSSFEVEAIRLLYTSGSDYTGDCSIDNVQIISS